MYTYHIRINICKYCALYISPVTGPFVYNNANDTTINELINLSMPFSNRVAPLLLVVVPFVPVLFVVAVKLLLKTLTYPISK